MGMIFLPGMRPGNVSGAAGSNGRTRSSERLIFGPQYRGRGTPRGQVPYEEIRTDNGRKERAAKYERAKDVAQSYDMAKHQPATTRERLRDVRARAAQVDV